MSLLEVRDLRVSFQRDGVVNVAVKGVSFSVNTGETLALVGESGSGKSVSALSTVELLGPAADVTGSVKFNGKELLRGSDNDLREVRGNKISFIFQEPMSSLNPLHTIEKQIAESLLIHQGLTGTKARARILGLMEEVGIDQPEDRLAAYPHQLSGGQRQRIMIAMALANQPELLVADEPTTALDVTIQAQILELLAKLQRERGMAMLFITHDLNIVKRFADRVAVMQHGEIVETGTTATIFAEPKHAYTRALLAAEATGGPSPVPAGAAEILTTDQLRIWFPIQRGILKRTVGYIKAVNAASLRIRAGETLGIVGESGSGKTTLALAVLRLIRSEGPIVFLGRDIQGLKARALRPLRSAMQIVFQDPFGSLSPRMSAYEIIAEGLSIHKIAGDPRTEVGKLMARVGLDPTTMDRYPHEFSGGQRQRIAIARAMILRPKLVVLDEPTSALDMTVQVQIIDLLRELQREFGLAYLFISHDLRVVRALSHRIMVMRRGDVVEEGETAAIFDAPKTDYTKALMAAAFDLKSFD